jgi:hypothetical protein
MPATPWLSGITSAIVANCGGHPNRCSYKAVDDPSGSARGNSEAGIMSVHKTAGEHCMLSGAQPGPRGGLKLNAEVGRPDFRGRKETLHFVECHTSNRSALVAAK